MDRLEEAQVLKALELFSCMRNADVEKYLRKNAIENEKRNTSRTYIYLDNDFKVFGYFSLALKETWIETNGVSKSLKRKIRGSNSNCESFSAYLIGQIGKNSNIQSNPLNLQSMLNDIYVKIGVAQKAVGGRVILLECEKGLVELYKKHGFKFLQTNPNNDLTQMIQIFKASG